MRQEYNSNAPWEKVLGYCRAVRIDNIIEVAGTTSVDYDGKIIGECNYYEQAKFILQKIEKALEELGATKNDIVRTRIYIIDIDQWKEIAKAHKSFFEKVSPACTLVQIEKLIDSKLLMEIEATAIISKQ